MNCPSLQAVRSISEMVHRRCSGMSAGTRPGITSLVMSTPDDSRGGASGCWTRPTTSFVPECPKCPRSAQAPWGTALLHLGSCPSSPHRGSLPLHRRGILSLASLSSTHPRDASLGEVRSLSLSMANVLRMPGPCPGSREPENGHAFLRLWAVSI